MVMWTYFPNKKGMITGCLLGGMGLGPLVFNFCQVYIANPDNLKASKVIYVEGQSLTIYDDPVANMAPKVLQYMSLFVAILFTISIFTVKIKP